MLAADLLSVLPRPPLPLPVLAQEPIPRAHPAFRQQTLQQHGDPCEEPLSRTGFISPFPVRADDLPQPDSCDLLLSFQEAMRRCYAKRFPLE